MIYHYILVRLVMNCQELVISIYQNNKTDKIQAYILEIQSAFQSLNSSGLHSLKIVNWEDFVPAILSNPQSINFEISQIWAYVWGKAE